MSETTFRIFSKKCVMFVLGLAMFCLSPGVINASEVSIGPGGYLIVDGEPFFPMGIVIGGDRSPEDLQRIKKSGFNFVFSWSIPTREYLDDAQRAGLKVMPVVDHFLKKDGGKESRDFLRRLPLGLLDEQSIEDLRNRVRELKDHPAVLGWMIADEPVTGIIDHCIQVRNIVMEEDPDHPTMAVVLPPFSQFNGIADIISTDHYPFRGPRSQPISDSARMIDEVTRACPDSPIWFFTQFTDYQSFWGPHQPSHEPSVKEMRLHNLLALTSGVRGLILWDYIHVRLHKKDGKKHSYQSEEDYERQMSRLDELIPELVALGDVLTRGHDFPLRVQDLAKGNPLGEPVRSRAVRVRNTIYCILCNISQNERSVVLLDQPLRKTDGVNIKFKAEKWLGECDISEDEQGDPVVTIGPGDSAVVALRW